MAAALRTAFLLAALAQVCFAGCLKDWGGCGTSEGLVRPLPLGPVVEFPRPLVDPVYRRPRPPVEVVQYGEGCACARRFPFEVEVPLTPPEPVTRTYGYDVIAPAHKPVQPRFRYDYQVEVPLKGPEPALLPDLETRLDRVLLPKPDCLPCLQANRLLGAYPGYPYDYDYPFAKVQKLSPFTDVTDRVGVIKELPSSLGPINEDLVLPAGRHYVPDERLVPDDGLVVESLPPLLKLGPHHNRYARSTDHASHDDSPVQSQVPKSRKRRDAPAYTVHFTIGSGEPSSLEDDPENHYYLTDKLRVDSRLRRPSVIDWDYDLEEWGGRHPLNRYLTTVKRWPEVDDLRFTVVGPRDQFYTDSYSPPRRRTNARKTWKPQRGVQSKFAPELLPTSFLQPPLIANIIPENDEDYSLEEIDRKNLGQQILRKVPEKGWNYGNVGIVKRGKPYRKNLDEEIRTKAVKNGWKYGNVGADYWDSDNAFLDRKIRKKARKNGWELGNKGGVYWRPENSFSDNEIFRKAANEDWDYEGVGRPRSNSFDYYFRPSDIYSLNILPQPGIENEYSLEDVDYNIEHETPHFIKNKPEFRARPSEKYSQGIIFSPALPDDFSLEEDEALELIENEAAKDRHPVVVSEKKKLKYRPNRLPNDVYSVVIPERHQNWALHDSESFPDSQFVEHRLVGDSGEDTVPYRRLPSYWRSSKRPLLPKHLKYGLDYADSKQSRQQYFTAPEFIVPNIGGINFAAPLNSAERSFSGQIRESIETVEDDGNAPLEKIPGPNVSELKELGFKVTDENGILELSEESLEKESYPTAVETLKNTEILPPSSKEIIESLAGSLEFVAETPVISSVEEKVQTEVQQSFPGEPVPLIHVHRTSSGEIYKSADFVIEPVEVKPYEIENAVKPLPGTLLENIPVLPDSPKPPAPTVYESRQQNLHHNYEKNRPSFYPWNRHRYLNGGSQISRINDEILEINREANHRDKDIYRDRIVYPDVAKRNARVQYFPTEQFDEAALEWYGLPPTDKTNSQSSHHKKGRKTKPPKKEVDLKAEDKTDDNNKAHVNNKLEEVDHKTEVPHSTTEMAATEKTIPGTSPYPTTTTKYIPVQPNV